MTRSFEQTLASQLRCLPTAHTPTVTGGIEADDGLGSSNAETTVFNTVHAVDEIVGIEVLLSTRGTAGSLNSMNIWFKWLPRGYHPWDYD
jgi:hypothetical protein